MNIFRVPLADRTHEQLVSLFVSTYPARAEWLPSGRRERMLYLSCCSRSDVCCRIRSGLRFILAKFTRVFWVSCH